MTAERAATGISHWLAIAALAVSLIAGLLAITYRAGADENTLSALQTSVAQLTANVANLTTASGDSAQRELQRYDVLNGKIDHLSQALCFLAQAKGAKVPGGCGQ